MDNKRKNSGEATIVSGKTKRGLETPVMTAGGIMVMLAIVLIGGCSRTPDIDIETGTDPAVEATGGASPDDRTTSNGAASAPDVGRAESIASMEEIELLGVKQWIVMRGVDRKAPVLLWVAGGPLGSELGWTRKYLSELENDVVFVNWEQPGTGKSYGAVDAREMKVNDYVEYIIALSDYLRNRFDKEKIYLAGHSWGSIIGLMAAEKRPDLFHAYIGIGQQVNALENDRIGYELVMERAEAAGETKVVETLKKNGPPPYTVEEKGKYVYLFQKLFVFSPHGTGTDDFESMSMLTPTEYTVFDSINLVRGVIQGVNYIYPQLNNLDFEKQIPRVEVPVYFITGRYDFTCVQDIAYRYFEKLEAPKKEFYWFEKSGHNSCYEERDKFISIMREDILRAEKLVEG